MTGRDMVDKMQEAFESWRRTRPEGMEDVQYYHFAELMTATAMVELAEAMKR